MELRTLRYFLTVAEEKNITHAAQKLNISQPPLSRQLSQLEEELGVALFIRGKRHIQLTEEGKYLAQQAQHILNMAEQTRQQLTEMKGQEVKGMLLLGVTETCSASILPSVLPQFRARFPQVSYDIWCGSSSDIGQRIEQGILDIGIIREPLSMENFEARYLADEAWIAITGKAHPLAASRSVTLEQLCREPLFIPSRQPLQNEIHNWLATLSGSYEIAGMYNQISSIIPLITGNMGVAICPESVKKYTDDRLLSYLNIRKPKLITGLYMIAARSRLKTPAAKAFWEYAGAAFTKEGGGHYR